MHRRQGAAHLDPDSCELGRRERSDLVQPLFERSAFDELHPDADTAVDAVGAVDGHDVWMAYAREETSFLHNRGAASLRVGTIASEELQRDFTNPGARPTPDRRRRTRRCRRAP